MTQLSDQQETLRASIKKGAIIGGVILGVIVAALAYWLLGGQGSMIRQGGAGLAGLLAAGGVYRKSMSSGAVGAKCAKCNAAFSISRTDKAEMLVKSEARESRKELENGDIGITTWLEEVYDVDDTYTCSKCADITHKKYQNTRKRDEKTVVKSAGKKGAASGKSNSRGKAKQSSGNSQRKG
jgi:hypothetical protein